MDADKTTIALGDKITLSRKTEKLYGFPPGTVGTVTAIYSGGKMMKLRKKKSTPSPVSPPPEG